MHCLPHRLPPGATIGILGNGQLGRMLALAAARLGYRTHVYGPDSDSPAEQVASASTVAAYEDNAALVGFAAAVEPARAPLSRPVVPPVALRRPAPARVADRPVPIVRAPDVVRAWDTVAEREGIVPGFPIGRWLPEYADGLLVCVTEVASDAAIDRLVEVVAGTTSRARASGGR